MTKDELLALCAAYPGAAVDCPSEDGGNVVVRHAAGRKWFALVFERDGKLCVNLKCKPMKADFWRAAYPAVTPGWHMNHTHWNTVEVNAGKTDATSAVQAAECVCRSFLQVCNFRRIGQGNQFVTAVFCLFTAGIICQTLQYFIIFKCMINFLIHSDIPFYIVFSLVL